MSKAFKTVKIVSFCLFALTLMLMLSKLVILLPTESIFRVLVYTSSVVIICISLAGAYLLVKLLSRGFQCLHLSPEPINRNQEVNLLEEIARSPIRYNLKDVLLTIKFGRPSKNQEFLDSCIAQLSELPDEYSEPFS